MTSILEHQPPKKYGLFLSKQGSVGFQVYIDIPGHPKGVSIDSPLEVIRGVHSPPRLWVLGVYWNQLTSVGFYWKEDRP